MTPSLPDAPHIKICGVTREEDVHAAVACDARYLGFNFYPDSPRFLELDRARRLRDVVPDGVRVVGVFVNADGDLLRRTIDEVGLDLVQFHGDESLEAMQPFAPMAIRAVRYRPEISDEELGAFDDFYGLLVDAPSDSAYGGTGEAWAWSKVAPWCVGRRVFLAGGLRPDNVAAAMAAVPGIYAVDVCSGVEESPGIKSPEQLASFRDHVLKGCSDRVPDPSRLEVNP